MQIIAIADVVTTAVIAAAIINANSEPPLQYLFIEKRFNGP